MDMIIRWYKSLPIVSRTYLTACFVTTIAVHIELINPLHLYLNWSLIFKLGTNSKFEIWRLITNFLYFDKFGLNFIFQMLFLIPHCIHLEKNDFAGRTGSFVYMFIYLCFSLLIVGFSLFYFSLLRIIFLGPSLSFAVVYIWSRRNPDTPMSFLGVINFKAPYLPIFILVIGFLLGQSPVFDLLGIFVGHIYYFFEDVYPRYRPGRKILATPQIFHTLFDQPAN
eukprot:TRINITY_DN10605_c0_g1_i1.p1 TRINITY_DN10605_c0_g1~~TRINITY_DN10605_c0_g1_i1.p1  ORF type:complete len:224 (-),score=24.23 TRINITY_DN10605_c0_g1_i1:38-709(-)